MAKLHNVFRVIHKSCILYLIGFDVLAWARQRDYPPGLDYYPLAREQDQRAINLQNTTGIVSG
jgi:hypothetical protein